MKWSFATVGLIAAGLVGVVIILLFQNITINNEEDYYLLKEISEAAMIDAIDIAYYRDTGKLKIVQEKFVENFTRRFAEAANVINTNNYYIEFFDIMEIPPKVSVIVTTDIGQYTIFGNHLESQNYSVANSLDAIIEREELTDKRYDECYQTVKYYSIPYAKSTEYSFDAYVPQVVGDPSYFGYGGDWEVNNYDEDYKPRFINHLQTATQVSEYYLNFSKMYPKYGYTGYETSQAAFTYFATYQSKPDITLDYNEENNEYIVDWKMKQYECLSETDFQTYNGTVESGMCFIGIIFEIEWYNKNCKK